MAEFTVFRTDKVYLTDGTAAGTKAIAESPDGYSPYYDITQTDGPLTFFLGNDGLVGLDTHSGDLVSPDTAIKGLYYSPTSNLWPGFSAYIAHDRWVFTSPDHLLGYASGGEVKTIRDDINIYFEEGVTAFKKHGYFVGTSGTIFTLYQTDGTADGTVPLVTRDEDGSRFGPIRIDDDWRISDRMLFSGEDSASKWSLFATDGTGEGTERLAYDLGNRQSGLVPNDGRFLFTTTAPVSPTGPDHGQAMEVWTTDGTKAQTRMIADYDDLISASSSPAASLVLISQPFVVGANVFVSAERFSAGQDATVVFDVTGDEARLQHVFPFGGELIQATGIEDSGLDGGFAHESAVAVSSNGWLFFAGSDSDPNDILNGFNVLSGDTEVVKTLRGEQFDRFWSGDLGDKMIFAVDDGLNTDGLMSVDIHTLDAVDIVRDGDGLRDFHILNGRLYWSDNDGVYVTDGTAGGTHTLATPAGGSTVPAVLGSVTLDHGLFSRLGSLGDDLIDVHTGHKDERIDGGAGDDLIRTGTGDDRIDGGVGADAMRGGPGNDTYFADNPGDRVREHRHAGTDTIYASLSYTLARNVETLRLTGSADIDGVGRSSDDSIFGNHGDNRLLGKGGDDTLAGGRGDDSLSGSSGNDHLDGGTGSDTLLGGDGADRFVFAREADSPRGRSSDVILDFEKHVDRLDLRDIDADQSARGNQAFDFIGSHDFTGEPGELRFSGGQLLGDTDGNGHADLQIELAGVSHLFAHDLLL